MIKLNLPQKLTLFGTIGAMSFIGIQPYAQAQAQFLRNFSGYAVTGGTQIIDAENDSYINFAVFERNQSSEWCDALGLTFGSNPENPGDFGLFPLLGAADPCFTDYVYLYEIVNTDHKPEGIDQPIDSIFIASSFDKVYSAGYIKDSVFMDDESILPKVPINFNPDYALNGKLDNDSPPDTPGTFTGYIPGPYPEQSWREGYGLAKNPDEAALSLVDAGIFGIVPSVIFSFEGENKIETGEVSTILYIASDGKPLFVPGGTAGDSPYALAQIPGTGVNIPEGSYTKSLLAFSVIGAALTFKKKVKSS